MKRNTQMTKRDRTPERNLPKMQFQLTIDLDKAKTTREAIESDPNIALTAFTTWADGAVTEGSECIEVGSWSVTTGPG